ncbi:MAG: sialate O-acetylesterase [Capsulimonadaceae bacterium]|nr:sialate O-acetylesterase [Capsulimonadaceae bacterium]
MTILRRILCVAVLLATFGVQSAYAAITPGPLFTDNAVLQQELPIPVWGTADANEPITVSMNGQTVTTTADAAGAWSVNLTPMPAGGPYTLTITGTPADTITLKNILVGEVWICSGQSNMQYPLSGFKVAPELTIYAKVAIPTSADPMLHFAIVSNTIGITPRRTVGGAWQEAKPETVGNLTAVGYFFGRDLRKALGVPVGLIHVNWGGTSAEAWTSKEALQAVPELRHLVDEEAAYPDQYPKLLADYNTKLDAYNTAKAKYQADADAAKAAGTPFTAKAPTPPRRPPTYEHWPNGAAHLFNGMIAPLIPYGIRGAIWYQGENNGGRGYEYKTLFPTMIADWRARWGEGDFPFYFVQLAPFMGINKAPVAPGANTWADLREAQRLTLTALPNTGMAVITDLGASSDVHPRRKEPVGDRLALIARAQVYGENVEYSGPVLDSVKITDSKVEIQFTHAAGLKSIDVHDADDDGPVVATADKLVGFEVAGSDGNYFAADATIDGNSVVVSSASVSAPVAVRYGWANYPVANLANAAGLPASPFKFDNFPWASGPKDQPTAAK